MISVCRNANGFRFVAAFCAALIGAALQIAAVPARRASDGRARRQQRNPSAANAVSSGCAGVTRKATARN